MPKRPFTFSATAEIREAAMADSEAISALMSELGCPSTPEAIWNRIERMKSPGQQTIVADLDGRVVGFAGMTELPIYGSDAPICWLMVLAVSTPYRRHGVGRALLTAIEKWAAQRGLVEIRVNSREGSEDAFAFYESCGFGRTGARYGRSLGD
jgi:GNAT superfamily N-acetyltransferase